jgi:hypothetical protein
MTTTAVSTELTPQQQFEEKIKEKLRIDVGNLLPDSVLADMVSKAVNNMFFTKVHNSNGYHTREEPSWFEKAVAKELEQKLSLTIEKYMKDNETVIQEAVVASIKEKAPEFMAAFFVKVISNQAYSMGPSLASVVAPYLQR